MRRLESLLRHAMPMARGGVHVLAFHLVGAGTSSPVDLEAGDFRHQMESLAKAGTVISLAQALTLLTSPAGAAPQGGAPSVVLTFDDAYRNFVTEAWPLLRDLGLPVTLYVPTGFIDGETGEPMTGAGLPAASWRELARLREEGVHLGSHTHRHRELPGLSQDEVMDELERARLRLRQETGADGADFCYPRALASARVERLVAACHRSAAVAGGRLNRAAGFSPLRVHRVPVRRCMGPNLDPVLRRAVEPREWSASRWRRVRSAWRHRRGGVL